MDNSVNSFCVGKTVEKVVPQEDYEYWEIFFSDGTSLGIDSLEGKNRSKSKIGLMPSLAECKGQS